ncbi:MAG: hypothetical protein AAGI24_03750 [Pseudomonadota bacterium]
MRLALILSLFASMLIAPGLQARPVKLDLQGRTAPSDPGAFTRGYERCSDSITSLAFTETETDEENREQIELLLRYRPSPMLADTGADGLRAFFTTPSFMVREQTTYRLVTFHVHSADDADADENAPILGHFVHYGADGSYGVLSLKLMEGTPNPELEKLILAAVGEPSEEGLNPRRLLPPTVSIGAYLTPEQISACDYKVHWHFAEEPLQASAEQIRALQRLLSTSDS